MSAYDLSTSRGTPAYTTSSPKFGTHCFTSGGVLTNSSADLFLTTSGSDNGAPLGTGTIEGWIKSTSSSTVVAIGRAGWYWIGMVSGKVQGHYGAAASEVTLASSASFNDGNWHHVALVLVAGAGSLYVDGSRVATSATVPSSTDIATGGGFEIGGFGPSSYNPYDWPGQIDEVRLSTVARYTGTTYTVPTAAFSPTEQYTRALYHLDNSPNTDTWTTIAPNDSGLVFSPYNWLPGSSVSETINSGAYFRTIITGSPTSVSLWFDMSNVSSPVPQVAWRVDNGGWQSSPIASSVLITLPAGNTWTKHNLEVVVKSTSETVNRWNSPRNATVKFTGVALSPTSAALASVETRTLKVLILGDSITEGVRTLNSTATNDTDRNDATVGWAWRLAENLGAEVGCVGFGGTGLSVTGSGNVPVIGTFYASLWSGQSRDISTTPPDVIVVNIGANDSTTNTVSTCTTFLNNLLSGTPATTKILVMRPFNGTQAANLQSAIAACNSQARVKYVDTTGWWSSGNSSDSLHPYGYTNVGQLSPKLAAAVRTALQRGNLYLNVSGTATPVTVTI